MTIIIPSQLVGAVRTFKQIFSNPPKQFPMLKYCSLLLFFFLSIQVSFSQDCFDPGDSYCLEDGEFYKNLRNKGCIFCGEYVDQFDELWVIKYEPQVTCNDLGGFSVFRKDNPGSRDSQYNIRYTTSYCRETDNEILFLICPCDGPSAHLSISVSNYTISANYRKNEGPFKMTKID